MEQATSKQVNYLIKLGLDKSEAEKLTKSEASKKIKDLMLNSIEKESETTTSTTETKKKSSTKTKAKADTPKVETTSNKVNYETDNKVIEMLLNSMRTDDDFKKKTKVQESKFDEFAIYVYNYAKKNNVSGGFYIDTDNKDFANLEKTFNDKGFETCMSELYKTDTKKETKETSKENKKATTSTTNKSVENKVEIKETETKSKSKAELAFEQLCMELGI